MRVLLVGCGNPLRRDDGAGWRVVEALARRWADNIAIRLGQQLVPEWAVDFASADVAFIVDASSSQRTQITRLGTEPPLIDSHVLGSSELLGLTERAYGESPVAYLVEVPATDFRFGEGLSPATAAAARDATRLLELCLTALLSGTEASGSDAPPAVACTYRAPPRR